MNNEDSKQEEIDPDALIRRINNLNDYINERGNTLTKIATYSPCSRKCSHSSDCGYLEEARFFKINPFNSPIPRNPLKRIFKLLNDAVQSVFPNYCFKEKYFSDQNPTKTSQ